MIDKRTDKLGLPLPHPENQLSEDVLRIQRCFALLDTAVGNATEAAGRAQATADTVAGDAGQRIESLRIEVQGEIEGMRTEVQGEIEGMRTEVQGEIEGMRQDVATGLEQALSRSVMRVVAHADRGQLRAIADARQGDVAVVRGLGLFDFVPGSTEPDDDETAFAAPGGVWEVQSVSLDMAGDVLLRYVHTATWFRTVDVTSTVSTLAAGGTARVLLDGVVGVDGGERMLVVPPAEASPLLTARAWSDYWRRITLELGNPSSASLSVPTGSPWRVIIMYGGA